MADEKNKQIILQTGDDSGAESDDTNNIDDYFYQPEIDEEASPSKPEVLNHFIDMGFPRDLVSKIIEEHGAKNEEKILEKIHQYMDEKGKQRMEAEDDSGAKRYDIINIDSDTEDELEIKNEDQPNCSSRPIINGEASSSNSKLLDKLTMMGFPKEIVSKVIEECGEENDVDMLIDEILTREELADPENSAQPELEIQQDPFSPDDASSWSYSDISDPDIDSLFDDQGIIESDSEIGDPLPSLLKMGYENWEASTAIERLTTSGEKPSIQELVDFIHAAQFAKQQDALLPPEEKPIIYDQYTSKSKKKQDRSPEYEVVLGRKKPRGREKKIIISEDDEKPFRLPNPMIGFTIPFKSTIIKHRNLPKDIKGPPYFYFENVATAPLGTWQEISRCLYNVEPEFVDSKHFCAAARKRGYVHNLPIENRFPLQPRPPRTIHEAFPHTHNWWPSWDPRTKLNCVRTRYCPSTIINDIRNKLKNYRREDPPEEVKKYVLTECRKWNLVWVGEGKVAKLDHNQIEKLLGFPRNHTFGLRMTNRYAFLGNSFQVDTVAYHLSVLKDMYPNGINVLSLFSGIGGAEVALHRLGIPLKNVVSVDKLKLNQEILRRWWNQTKQQGNLVEFDDVRDIDDEQLGKLVHKYGGFDLIIGGSPCNNLSGSNRVSRVGLDGKESILFYDYVRILKSVKSMMANGQ